MAEEKIFKDLPELTSVKVVDREDVCGFTVSWVEPGFGFGQFEFGLDKETGEFFGSSECMDPNHVGRILMRLVGTAVFGPGDKPKL